jgi:CHRD domain
VKNIRSALTGIIGCGVLALIASCGSSSSGSSTPATVVRSASLTGAGENPPSASTATGSGAVVVNPTTMEITGGMTFSGLTPTAGGHHIHQAPAGNPTGNGPVIIGLLLASDGVTAVVPPNTTLTAAQYNALLAGELYFNVHSTNNLCPPAPDCSAGEIRGQINVQGGMIAGVSSLTAAKEVPATTSTATGKGTVVVDQATRNILIAYITHDVANASAAHIHSALGPGTNGGVIVGFANLQTNFDGAGTNLVYPPAGSQMTAQNVSDFLINYLYFNVHSTNNLCAPAADCTAGEIRGDITAIQ